MNVINRAEVYTPASDEELVRSILSGEHTDSPFVNTHPAADSCSARKGTPAPDAENIELAHDFESLIEEKRRIDSQILTLKEQSNELRTKIASGIESTLDGKDAKRIIARCGAWQVFYNELGRHTIDTEALKKDGLYEKYVTIKTTRYMKISQI